MHPVAERFIEEIRTASGFVAAAERDPAWHDQLDAIERALRHVYDHADEIPAAQEVFDFICDAIGDRAVPLKARLLALVALMEKCPKPARLRGVQSGR